MKITYLVILILSLVSRHEQKDKTLVWSDEFDRDGAPDSTKWNYDIGDGCPDNCGWGNNELQYYTRDEKNVRVKDGKLLIEAIKDSIQSNGFTSTKLISKHKGDWLYGRFEIKA